MRLYVDRLSAYKKILAQAGYDSRRAYKDLIAAEWVRVNAQFAGLSSKGDPKVEKMAVDYEKPSNDRLGESSESILRASLG